MKRLVEVRRDGMIRIRTHGESGWLIAEYEIDTLNPAVRLGLCAMGWTPPSKNHCVKAETYVKVGTFDDAKETQEKKTESDAGEALQTKTD